MGFCIVIEVIEFAKEIDYVKGFERSLLDSSKGGLFRLLATLHGLHRES